MKGEPKVRLWQELSKQHEQNARFAAQQALKILEDVAKTKQVKLRLTPEYRRLCELARVAP